MPMQMKCPNPACTTMLNVREEFAGKMIKCPTCASTLMVPQPAAMAAVSAPAAPAMSSPEPAFASSTPIPPEMNTPPAGNFMDTFWALCDKNNLDRKSTNFLLAGLAAMLFLLFCMLLPRYTETRINLADQSVLGRDWLNLWIMHFIGAIVLLGTILEMVFLLISFAKMHVFLRYSFFAGALWGAFCFALMFFYMVVIALSDRDSGTVRTEFGVGIGTYLAILASLGITGAFGLLSLPEVMKLVKKQQAKPAV